VKVTVRPIRLVASGQVDVETDDLVLVVAKTHRREVIVEADHDGLRYSGNWFGSGNNDWRGLVASRCGLLVILMGRKSRLSWSEREDVLRVALILTPI
jgi:hypothetical protein